ncbi:MAG: site-specific integrase [Candidatus Kaistia colombiensis]|nr:MAG: site-specific integrase [Kaistia sp.]
MSEAPKKLTKRLIDGLEASSRRFVVWDADLKGFGIRVETSGTKAFILRYRPKDGGRDGPKRFVTIGRYGALTPEEARSEARSILGSVAKGADPASEKAAAKIALTVKALFEEFERLHVAPKLKPNTAASYRSAFNAHIEPAIGRKRAADVQPADLLRYQAKLDDHPASANRVLAVVSAMYAWGEKHGFIGEGTNPAAKVTRFGNRKRERFLGLEELERLGAAIKEGETIGIPWEPDPLKKTKHAPKAENRRVMIGREPAAALRLLMLTGARLREILHLKWQEVDLERGLLLLPDSKTGKKTIVLNAPAMLVLQELPRTGIYVIAGTTVGSRDEKPRADLKRPWALVSKRAGLSGVRVHDLRHTFASYGAGANLGLPIIGKLLGHSQASTTNRYAHLADDPVKRASEAIGSTIAAALDGKVPGNVVALKK